MIAKVKITGSYGSLEVSKTIEVELGITLEEFAALDEIEQSDLLDELTWEQTGIATVLEGEGYDVEVGDSEWTAELAA